MTERPSSTSRALRVPSGRLTRLARLGSMAAGIAGTAALRGAGELGRGRRPGMRQLLVTPGNLVRLAEELARMRGAAMKVGQLLSMDAGEVLPPELADILARLRDDAHFMPPRQLRQVLNANWGEGWLRSFRTFEVRPIAAASIGQVHRATLRDGRDVAIKVQYPGVAKSIDSDVANIGALIRLSGLLPKGFEIGPYLDEARRQLREETDYAREGQWLRTFGERLDGSERFVVPEFHGDWSTEHVLTMSFLDGRPIEEAATLPTEARDGIAANLIGLFLREIFEFGEMQSDPNFANYRYVPGTGRIVLLDFGATRVIDRALVGQYRRLLSAGLARDEEGMRAVAGDIGFIGEDETPDQRARILDMIETVFSAIRSAEAFDFADGTLNRRMQAKGMALAETGYVPPPLPMDVLYLQRKIGGLFLLASRLKAKVAVRDMLAGHLEMGACDASSASMDTC